MNHRPQNINHRPQTTEHRTCGPYSQGFTLIEVLVSVSIFAMTMLVATGAVFSIVDANKKTHTLKSVMTNLNFALESMVRDIRVGFRYSCDGGGDCTGSPGTTFRFKANRDVDGGGYNVADGNDMITFARVLDDGRGRIQKTVGASTYFITAPEIDVETLGFYVIGTATSPDTRQPKVVMLIKGAAGTGNTRSNFNIQTTVSQRPIDS
jgi:prepilin-type N-terminal cleavage/methylation domain-containing protein